MNMKDQLHSKIKMKTAEEKRRKQEEKIKNKIALDKHEKLRKESSILINERLTQIILTSPFYNEKGWIKVDAREDGWPSIGKTKRQLILDNGYEIDTKDIKRFCRKNKLKIRYEYYYRYYKGLFRHTHTYRLYKGEENWRCDENIYYEYFSAYIISA